MRIVDAEIKGNWTLRHFILFSLFFFLLAGYSDAQCGNCDDNNPCTRDWCNGTQCLHEPQICDQSGTIEKTRQETTNEAGPIGFAPANGGEDVKPIISPQDTSFNPDSISVPDTTINCDDGNPCTRDYPGDGSCRHEAISCDDGDSSTIDTCGPSGCINTPAPALEENRLPQPERQSILVENQIMDEIDVVDGKSDVRCEDCDDGNACTADTCDPLTGCSHTAVDCNDNDACTSDTCDPATGCSHAAMDCNDNDACTADTCDPATGCSHAAMDCDDNDACTSDTCDHATGCSHSAVDCNDNDAFTTDSCNSATGCVNEPIVCDDGNDSTEDSCQSGECIYQLVGGYENNTEILAVILIADNLSSISQNNSTALSAASSLEQSDQKKCHNSDPCMKLIDEKNCTYQPINCDDGNSSTNDYCYRGDCYNTTLDCSASDNCHIGTFDGNKCIEMPKCFSDNNPCTDDCDPATGKCVHANNNALCDDGNACTTGDTCSGGSCKGTAVRCDDNNPCTYNTCDSKKGCYYPNKCKEGQTCVGGTCKYPYYYNYPYYPYYPYQLYYPYGMPYAPPTPTAPAPAPSKPQSYTIPAGTSITLPWGGSMLSAEVLQVYNGLAYPRATPISFIRVLGSPAEIASIGRTSLSAMNQWEMIGLSWKEASFKMTLIQPNKIVLPAQVDGRNVVHLTGANYDYYFLRSPPAGNWTVQIMPVNAATGGTGYSLLSGLVQGAIPPNQA